MTVQVHEQYKFNGVIYRQRYNTCTGKECKCHKGEKHGPYWYAFSDAGMKYVGMRLPEHITNHVALLKASKPKLAKLKKEIRERITRAEAALEKARRELRTVENLEIGEYTASEVLKTLGLSQFNGHAE